MRRVGLLVKWMREKVLVTRVRMAVKLFPTEGWGTCSNRVWRTARYGKYFIEVTIINESEPSHYSREEVYGFLKIVRREEMRTGWTCPEPEGDLD